MLCQGSFFQLFFATDWPLFGKPGRVRASTSSVPAVVERPRGGHPDADLSYDGWPAGAGNTHLQPMGSHHAPECRAGDPWPRVDMKRHRNKRKSGRRPRVVRGGQTGSFDRNHGRKCAFSKKGVKTRFLADCPIDPRRACSLPATPAPASSSAHAASGSLPAEPAHAPTTRPRAHRHTHTHSHARLPRASCRAGTEPAGGLHEAHRVRAPAPVTPFARPPARIVARHTHTLITQWRPRSSCTRRRRRAPTARRRC